MSCTEWSVIHIYGWNEWKDLGRFQIVVLAYNFILVWFFLFVLEKGIGINGKNGIPNFILNLF